MGMRSAKRQPRSAKEKRAATAEKKGKPPPLWKVGDVVTTKNNKRIKLPFPVGGRSGIVLLAGTPWTVEAVELPEDGRGRPWYTVRTVGIERRLKMREGRFCNLPTGKAGAA